MKFLLIIFLFFNFFAFGQNRSGTDMITECIKEKIQQEEKNGTNVKEFFVSLENKEFIKINDTIIQGVKVHFLSQNEMKNRSKKGFVFFNISPFIVEDNTIRVIIMKEFYEKKRINFLNKSIYFFNYNCKEEQFILNDVNHQLW